MKKDKYSVFKLDDYTSQQLGYLEVLTLKYPSIKWMQLLSPYHCKDLYLEILDADEGSSIYDVVYDAFSKYGRITVMLDYALDTVLPLGDILYKDQAVAKLLKDGDADTLAKRLLVDKGIQMFPTRTIVMHRREIGVEPFILREPFDEESIRWCLEYVGFTADTANLVCIWNENKNRYHKQLQEDFDYE